MIYEYSLFLKASIFFVNVIPKNFHMFFIKSFLFLKLNSFLLKLKKDLEEPSRAVSHHTVNLHLVI